ncbi:MAG: 30S ribosomal protein S5 [Candidatus Nomurabacteria bacterium GW2011_GWA2_35_80]|uniref:Small ribosomal subunit protein uS5 n=1 Tax=Candidatus Nomurabacteria bacterium GW2011_GWA2_35_80 TaxID=1618733 RepID=A0A0G0FMJ1_9BACT|nr:MAG: 30S ribosomal protein S5 [Candidatus Nomurabacteria bacterium GW2011_GWA2_35_80]
MAEEENRKKNNNRRSSSFGRPKPEFDQKILSIRRVTRVVAGGRRFSFSVALVAGDKKGSVGLGLGKAGDTSLAINKAIRNAKKNMIRLKLTKTMSLPHEVSAKFSGSYVMLMPNKGRGLVAGTVVRDITKLAGMKDVTGKILSGSKNKLNNAKAVMVALSQISSKYSKKVVENVIISEKEIAPFMNLEEKPLVVEAKVKQLEQATNVAQNFAILLRNYRRIVVTSLNLFVSLWW